MNLFLKSRRQSFRQLAKTVTSSLVILTVFSAAFADETGKPVSVKKKAVRETTQQLMRRGSFDKPRPITEPKRNEEESDRSRLQNDPRSPSVSSWPILDPAQSELRNRKSKISDIPLFSVSTIIEGSTVGESGYFPPDTTGDVGPRDVVISVNGRIRSYNRTGAVGSLNINADTFFASVRGGLAVIDPRVIYDRITQRWFLSEITRSAASGDNLIVLAVSDGPNIDPTTVWSFYQFPQNIGGAAAAFADYETLGVDANAVYIGSNRFGSSFQNCDMFVIRKSDLLAGTLTVTPFRNLIGGGAGMFTPWGCTNDDPAATTGLIVGVNSSGFGSIKARRVTNPGGTPVLGAEVNLTVPTTTDPPAMPISTSASTTGTVSAIDDRLFYARIFRDRQTGVQTLWTAHGIGVNASGVATTTSPRAASRWYQIANPLSGTISLVQSGTAFDSTATNPLFCTIPSVAMNAQGHAFTGFSLGNLANSPGIGGAARLKTDPLGTIGTPFLIKPGVNYYNAQSSTTNKRWGDYSVTVVDPRDGMSIWTFQEYASAANTWRVAAVKMLAPAPTISSLSPSSVRQGNTNVNITVTGTGIFDPDNTYPDHLAVTFPSGVAVNSVTWNSPTQATVNISVSPTATVAATTLTLTNPDGQVATSPLTILPSIKTVSGTLSLQSYSGAVTGLQFTAELRNATTNALIESTNITGLGAGNSFSLTTTQPAGSYKLRIKGSTRFLAKSQNITIVGTTASGLSYSLLNGDVNGDNSVGGTDFNLLRAAWGTFTSGAADLNGDGSVGGTDFNILRNSWGLIGDN